MSQKEATAGPPAPKRHVPKRSPPAAQHAPRVAGTIGAPNAPDKARSSRKPTGRRTLQQLIGQRAEDFAADFLRARGLEVLERNYRRRLGELDIIARDGDVLVIVEVRCRASRRFGGAVASVDGRKQRRLVRAAAQLLQQRREFSHLRVRFDVISVSETGFVSPHVEWFQHAFLT